MTIEELLISAGCECGTVKNFNNYVYERYKLDVIQRWYFRTPNKQTSNGLITVSLDMALPFQSVSSDTSESIVISRLSSEMDTYKDELISLIRSSRFIIPPDSINFTIIPFWAGESSYRNDLSNFGGLSIHIYNAVFTVKWRNSWFNK